MKTIGLCMIVKNESRVVERCLDSVRPLVDYVLIDDTGSTDGTQQIIRDWLDRHGIPGEVTDEPWRDFAHNRSAALARLRQREGIDYALIMDADDVLALDDGFDPAAFKAGLSADLYHVRIQLGPVRYHRPHLCNNRLDYRYRGVVHEFLEGPDGAAAADAHGLTINAGVEGARSQDPDKYRKDAEALAAALETEQDPLLRSRYTFYLGQSWRDCGEHEKALAAYLDRAGMGFWDEEVFVSLYNAAQMKEKLNHPGYEVIGMHMRAFEACPRRAESLHAAARYCRGTGKNHQGHMLAKQGLDIPQPSGGLFVEPWVYEYGLLDELAVNGYWAGKHQDCLTACERMLTEGRIPEGMRERVEMNAGFAREKLGDPAPQMNFLEPTDAQVKLGKEFKPMYPRIFLAILAKQKEPILPFFLLSIAALDYPKSRITLYIRTNNNTDQTAEILRNWIEANGREYEKVTFDDTDVSQNVEKYAVHEWNPERFSVLGAIRQKSLQEAMEDESDFYFVVDVDNFILPPTLRELVSLNLAIVAPFLRHADPTSMYSNYHAAIDENGYFAASPVYNAIWERVTKGVIELPVVHCTYLVRRDVLPLLSYDDGSGRYEYVIFSDSARRAGVPQYIDNRNIYGYLTLDENPAPIVRLIGGVVATTVLKTKTWARPAVFFACGVQGSGSTWLFNLARRICQIATGSVQSIYADFAADVPWDLLGTMPIVVKTHAPAEDLREVMYASPGAEIVMTVRDPRDSVVSLMQRFGYSFEDAVTYVSTSAGILTEILRNRSATILRYEDGFIGQDSTCCLIADCFRLSFLPGRRRELLDSLSESAVKAEIRELQHIGVLGDPGTTWDPVTQWHANHVGDKRTGKFRDYLSPEQDFQVTDRTSGFCNQFGYNLVT